MWATAAWKPRESEYWGNCAAVDPKKSLWQTNDEKRTSPTMKRKTNGLSIMSREQLLWQDRDFTTLKQLRQEVDNTGTAENAGLMT
jgi:hypothetical protein